MTVSAGSRADLAIRVLTGLFNDRDPDVARTHIAEDYIQHNPAIPSGREPVIGFVASLAGVEQPIIEPKRAVAEGDFAAVHSRDAVNAQFQLDDGPGTAVVDIFRLAQGLIVEHWDVLQPVPESTASGNDMCSQLS